VAPPDEIGRRPGYNVISQSIKEGVSSFRAPSSVAKYFFCDPKAKLK